MLSQETWMLDLSVLMERLLAESSGSSDTSVENFNYYAKVSVDSQAGYGPETIVINHWSNFNDKYKIGGKFHYFVNWWKTNDNE